MVLKEFTLQVPGKGSVDVSFYLHFDAHTVSVNELKIHADYDSGLPRHAQLKQENGKWELYADKPVLDHNNIVIAPQYYEDELSTAIVDRILALKATETP